VTSLPDWARDLEASRPGGASGACAAPHTSMYLDARGRVLACCHSHLAPLGSIADATLEEIWWGEDAQRLRRSLDRYELPEGCRHCRWQLADGNTESVYLRQFDRFRRQDDALDWPAQIEFAFSNRCNLECVMCNGDFSSTIRSRREGRPPLPMAYGEAFFAQLPPFLRRLRQARFLGGEPFLVPEYQRIWDLLIADGREVDCDVTTNGTVWTPRMEATLAALPFSIGVSVDGVTRRTVEAVRVGADFDTVMANVERFAAYCSARGTPFTLTYCLMVPNWHELPAFVDLADGLGAEVVVNTVTWPPHLSLYELTADELAPVVDGLSVAAEDDRSGVVEAEVRRLQHWLDRRQAPGDGDAHFEHWSPLPAGSAPEGVAAVEIRREADLEGLGTGPVGVLVTDGRDVVTAVESSEVLGVDGHELLGLDYGTALRAMARRHGDLLLVSDEVQRPDYVERNLLFDRDGRRTRVRAVTTVQAGPDEPREARTAFTVVDRFPD
jgi:radical SAM protein with 4Fe4S-binding SPASM domain